MTQSKKVVLAVLITLLITVLAVSCFVVLPSTVSGVAQAASETVNIVPPSVETQHNHADGSWTELTQTNISQYISEEDGVIYLGSGNYYLGEDITLTTNIELNRISRVTLCLNGNILRFDTLNSTSGYIDCSYGDFTLCDCNTSTAHLYYQATRLVADNNTYYFVVDDGSPEFDAAYANASMRGTIYGGVLEGVKNFKGDAATYGVIQNLASSNNTTTFTMNGGTITGVYQSSVSSSSRFSGAILAGNSHVVINGGAVVGNGAAQYGGCAIVSVGLKTTITINDGLFAYNCVPGSSPRYGGAIYVSRGGNTLNINGGEIRNNYGVGISVVSHMEDITINDTLIANNAYGAISEANSGATITINRCTISGHIANDIEAISIGSNLVINDSKITGNYIGIGTYDGNVTINNSEISENTYGGVVYRSPTEGILLMKGCTITDNRGSRYYGGVVINGDAILEDCTITGNYSASYGGGVQIESGDIYIINCTITDNDASQGGDDVGDPGYGYGYTLSLAGGQYGYIDTQSTSIDIVASETECYIQSFTQVDGVFNVHSGASARVAQLSEQTTVNVDGTLTFEGFAVSRNITGNGTVVLAAGSSMTIDSGKTVDCDVHLTQDAQFVMSAGKFGGVLSSAEDFAGTTNISGGNFAVPQQESLLPEGNIMVLLQSGDSGYDANYPYIVMPVNTEGTINSIIVAWQTTEFTYNGKVLDAVSVGQTITDGEGNPIEQTYTLEYSYVLDGVTYYGLPKNAGTYDLTVKLYFKSETYAYIAEGAVSGIVILPKEVEVIWGKTTTFTYDGQAHAPTAYVSQGVVVGEELTISVQGATDAGTRTAQATSTNGNYVLTNTECQFTINKKVVAVVWGDNVKFVYNGQAQAPTATADSGIEGVQVDVTVAGNINAGDYTATATDNSGNFELTNATLNYTIGKKQVAVVWSNTELTYTGEAIAPTATVDTGVEGDTLTLTVSGGQTKNGTYIATATTDNTNYELINSGVQFTIAGGPQGGGMSGLATAMLIITIVSVLGAGGLVGVVLLKGRKG